MLTSILLFIAGFFLLIFAYALFAPLLLEIDSRIGLYKFSVVPVFNIRWVNEPFPGYAEMRIFGFRKRLTGSREKKAVVSIDKTKRKPRSVNFKKIIAVFQSFRVKKCFVNIDTGDMLLNGELFPLIYLFSFKTKHTCRINFQGKTEVVLSIQNNSFRMIKAFLTTHN